MSGHRLGLAITQSWGDDLRTFGAWYVDLLERAIAHAWQMSPIYHMYINIWELAKTIINNFVSSPIHYLFIYCTTIEEKDSNQGFDELSLSLGSKTQPKTVPK